MRKASLTPPSNIELLSKLAKAPHFTRKDHRMVSGLSQNYTILSLGVVREVWDLAMSIVLLESSESSQTYRFECS